MCDGRHVFLTYWVLMHGAQDRHAECTCTALDGGADLDCGVGEAGGFMWTDGSPVDFMAWGLDPPTCSEGDSNTDDCGSLFV